ncbi:hypothetical protein NQZ68_014016 [Dissostichus eleginoides]|nr:hypothetical protein NQZ68_014016 [Dissostichus eleginoides]
MDESGGPQFLEPVKEDKGDEEREVERALGCTAAEISGALRRRHPLATHPRKRPPVIVLKLSVTDEQHHRAENARVPVARQPSSGVWGPADRQLLMKPGRRVEGARCREGAIRPPFSCLTRPGMRLHTSFLGFKHPPTGARVSCLKAIIGSPHLVHHHPPPHHPVTNIDTAKEGAACSTSAATGTAFTVQMKQSSGLWAISTFLRNICSG